MSMSAFSVVGESQLARGFTRLEFPSFFDPVVVDFDRKEAGGIGSIKLGDDEPKKGVYAIVETEPTRGRHNVTVGLGGVDGDSQTLLERVKYHDYNPPSVMEGWDKAILICDWEKDIRNSAIKFGSVAQKTQDNKIIEAMKSEVHLLEKMLHAELMQFTGSFGSLNVHRNKSKRFNYFMANPDNERYEYYIGIAMGALRNVVPKYDAPPTRKHIKHFIKAQLLAVGETVYGSYDSEAIILDKKGNAKVTRFKKNAKNAGKKDLEELEGISLHKAASAILEANEENPNANAPTFWKVINNNKLIPIKDLEES